MAKQICITPGTELDKRRLQFEARFLSEGNAPDAAKAMGENAAVQWAHKNKAIKVRNLLDDIEKWNKNFKPMLERMTGPERAQYAASLLIRDMRHRFNEIIPVEARTANVRNLAKARLGDFDEAFVGLRGDPMKKMSTEIKMELGGLESNNPVAKKAAQSVRDTMQYLLAEAKDAGIDIRNLSTWYYPQVWSGAKLQGTVYDKFVTDLVEAYSTPGKMVPLLDDTGAPLVGQELEDVVKGMAESIRIGELYSTDIGTNASAVGNKYKAPRVIQFLDHDLRMRFETEYAVENIAEVMHSHLGSMTRNIGLARTFGHNPEHMFRRIIDEVKKAPGVTDADLISLERGYKVVNGYYNRPANVQFAEWMQSSRDILDSAIMTASILSQPSDIVPYTAVSVMNGIPPTKAMKNFLEGLAVKDSPETRALARSLGVEVEATISMLDHADMMSMTGKAAEIKDAVFRWNMMKHWASANERSAQNSLLRQIQEVSHLSLKDADAAMNGKLSQFGYTENDWSIIRNAKQEELNGAKFVSAANVADYKFELMAQGVDPKLARKMANDASQRLSYHIKSDVDLMTTKPQAATRAALTGYTQPGTGAGEVARSLMHMKGYPAQFTMNWTNELLAAGSWKNKAAASAVMFAGMLTLGMFSLQLKRLAKGQGLADMTSTKVWGMAALQSGGMGIYGDFLANAFGENRFGQDFLTTMAGPTVGFINDTVKLTAGNIGQGVRGERANFPSEAIKYASRYTPGLNLPVVGLGVQRLFVDQLRLAVDPSGTRRSFMAEESKAKTDYNSKYLWRRGELLPEFLK